MLMSTFLFLFILHIATTKLRTLEATGPPRQYLNGFSGQNASPFVLSTFCKLLMVHVSVGESCVDEECLWCRRAALEAGSHAHHIGLARRGAGHLEADL